MLSLNNSNDLIANSYSLIQSNNIINLENHFITITQASSLTGNLTPEQVQSLNNVVTNTSLLTQKANLNDVYTRLYIDNEFTKHYNISDVNILLNNTLQTSDLNDYYNTITINNLLSTKLNTSQINNYYNKIETNNLLNNKVNTLDLTNNYYNNNTVTNLLNAKLDSTTIDSYYNKSQTDILLNNKLNSTDLNNYYNSNYINDTFYTKTNVDSTFTNYYNLTQINTLFNDVVNNAPDVLNTIGEISQALNNDANYFTTVNTLINSKRNINDSYSSSQIDFFYLVKLIYHLYHQIIIQNQY